VVILKLFPRGSFQFVLENLKFLDMTFCDVVENWAAVGDNWPNNNFVKQKLISDVHFGFSANKRVEKFYTIICIQQNFFDVLSES
jgi:hypothetical protein